MSATRPNPRRRRHRGFGLLEVMISATLLLVGLAGVVSFAAHASTTAAHQRHITIAAHIAEVQIEKLVLLNNDDARLAAGPHTGLRYDDVGGPAVTGDYRTSWVVQTATPLVGARTIVVTVEWKEGGTTRTTTLKTVRT